MNCAKLHSKVAKLRIHINNGNWVQVSHTFQSIKHLATQSAKHYRLSDSSQKQHLRSFFYSIATQLHLMVYSLKPIYFHNTDFFHFFDDVEEVVCLLLSIK